MNRDLRKINVEVNFSTEWELLSIFQQIVREQRLTSYFDAGNYKFNMSQKEPIEDEREVFEMLNSTPTPNYRYEKQNGKTVLIIESRLNYMA